MNPLERIEAAVSRLEQISRREQTLLHWLLALLSTLVIIQLLY